MSCDNIRKTVRPYLPMLVMLLCIVQPLLDVLSFWSNEIGWSSVLTLALRFGMLFCVIGLAFLISQRKRFYFLLAGILGIFTICHMAVCWINGYEGIIGDLANLLRIYQLPMFTLSFITFLKQNRDGLKTVRRGFSISFVIILIVEVLSVLTDTNPYTYPNKQVGILGWFYFANAQSAILSMIVPVFLAYCLESRKFHPGWTLGLGGIVFAVLYCFATRLSYAALLGTTGGLAVSLLLLKYLHKIPAGKAAAAMALLAVMTVVLLPCSPMVKNNRLVAENAVMKQEEILAMVEADDAAAVVAGLEGKTREVAALRSAYEKYLPGPTFRYGLERTAEMYNYSTDAGIVCDLRLQKLNYCRMLLNEQPSSRLFGLELADMTSKGVSYDVENDFHGIYYLCGGVGLGLMFLFFGFYLIRIVCALVRSFKTYFTLENAGYGIAIICGIAHAYFTAGVLRRPNTIFYLAVILAAVHVLTQKREQQKEG